MPSFPPPPSPAALAEAPPPGLLRGRSPFASIQLGAYSTRPSAEGVVESLRPHFETRPDAPLRIHEVRVRDHQWFRVMAGPFSPEEARSLCHELAGRTPCMVRVEPPL